VNIRPHLPATLLLAFFVLGCPSEPKPDGQDDNDPTTSAGTTAAEGNAHADDRLQSQRYGQLWTEHRRPRQGLAAVYHDPEDAPELTDSYYDGDSEKDGSASAEAPPEPSNLPNDRSFSVGPANAGRLINGKALPLRGPYHRVLNRTARRNWYYGSDELLQLLEDAARRVAVKYTGSVLRVGNLSRREGGKIGPSVSHQSGRDADIGLFVTDLDNIPLDPGGFPRFDGVRGPLVDATGRYLFDVPRNWAFVEALVSHPRFRVQWIFLDTPLKAALLDYAIRTQAPAEAIAKVEQLIVRPQNSSPHADHYHIRIFCSDADTEYAGCRDYGPEWQWTRASRDLAQQTRDAWLERFLRGEETLNLGEEQNNEAPTLPAPVPAPSPASSPDQLPDPPTDIPIRFPISN
jgi:penicillin-insensitive murein endopeptidase